MPAYGPHRKTGTLMSRDDSPTKQPGSGDTGDDGAWSVPPEKDLDTVLANAAALAGELQVEVGGADLAPLPPEVDLSSGDSGGDLDRKLNQIDELIQSTQQELGVNSPAKQPGRADPPPHAVPNFMSEFTEPESAPEKANSAASGASTSGHAAPAGRTAAATAAPVPAPGELPAEFLAGPTKRMESTGAEPASAPVAIARTKSDDGATGRSRGGIAKLAAAPVNMGLFAVEAADRPFRWVGPRVRSLLGWAAILMLGAAAVVYVVARL